jgi:protein gp37
MSTSIEWTEKTWNPVTGCWPVSPGCAHCYAMAAAARLVNLGAAGKAYVGTVKLDDVGKPLLGSRARWTGTVRCHPDRLDQPRRWKKPRRVFVNSMSDLFHEDVPFEFVDGVFDAMEACPRHTFQILTKRPERMLEYMQIRAEAEGVMTEVGIVWRDLPDHVWLGTSVENLDAFAERVPVLSGTWAGLRFLSCEPLLGSLAGAIDAPGMLDGIGWVIAGGESGPKARPMRAEWVREIRDACAAAEVPFFFKQWGGPERTAKGRTLDGRTHDAYPPEPWRED